MKLVVDLQDLDDIRAAIADLSARLEGGRSLPSSGPAERGMVVRPYDIDEVRRTLAGYGPVRLPIVTAIAKGSPGRLPKAHAYALAEQEKPGREPAKVVAGLCSALNRGWRGRTRRTDRFVTTHRDGFSMHPELARMVLEAIDELLPTMDPEVADPVRRVLDDTSI